VEAEERDLVFTRFTNDDALELGLLLAEKARARSSPSPSTSSAWPAALPLATAGTVPDNAAWIERKKNLVWRMFRSSYGVGLKLAASNQTLEDNIGPPQRIRSAWRLLPIVVSGVGFVGTVAVSAFPEGGSRPRRGGDPRVSCEGAGAVRWASSLLAQRGPMLASDEQVPDRAFDPDGRESILPRDRERAPRRGRSVA